MFDYILFFTLTMEFIKEGGEQAEEKTERAKGEKAREESKRREVRAERIDRD